MCNDLIQDLWILKKIFSSFYLVQTFHFLHCHVYLLFIDIFNYRDDLHIRSCDIRRYIEIRISLSSDTAVRELTGIPRSLLTPLYSVNLQNQVIFADSELYLFQRWPLQPRVQFWLKGLKGTSKSKLTWHSRGYVVSFSNSTITLERALSEMQSKWWT